MPDDSELREAARTLGGRLAAAGALMATAESCTGGWIGKICTDLSGSSAWFAGGIIAYSNAVKRDLLGVPAAALDQHGAVSEAVVLAMAQGCRDRLKTNLGVAVSGIAGPDGGTPDKPVGLVWIGVSGAGGTRAYERRYAGDRETVRRATVFDALVLAGDATL